MLGIGITPVSRAVAGRGPRRSNLLRYSQDFSQSAVWGSQCVITPNAGTAPDGSSTASLVADASAGFAGLFQDIAIPNDNADYALSIFFNSGTSANVSVRLAFLDGSSQFTLGMDFNSTTGNLSNGSFVSVQKDTLPGGWYRIVGRAANNASGNTRAQMQLYVDASSGAATGNVTAWGAQFNRGRETAYLPTGAVAAP